VVLSADAIGTPGRADGNHKGSNDGVPDDDTCYRTLMKIVIDVRLSFTESSHLRFFVSRDQRCRWIHADKVAVSADDPIQDVLVHRDRRIQRLRDKIAMLAMSWRRYRDEDLTMSSVKINSLLSLLGSNASTDMNVIFALEGPPAFSSSPPNASAFAMHLSWHKQRRSFVSMQSNRMLGLLGTADSILRDAAHETHLMCERSVARPLPDLSDLSDSGNESSDDDKSTVSTTSSSPDLPDQCDHAPGSSGARANNSSSAWNVDDDSYCFDDVPDRCPSGYTPAITRKYATPEMQHFFRICAYSGM
jgi:hypothetical protein